MIGIIESLYVNGNRPATNSVVDRVASATSAMGVDGYTNYPTYLFPTFHFEPTFVGRKGEDETILLFRRAASEGVDLDIVSYPSFYSNAGTGMVRLKEALQINKNYKYQQEAFDVIEYLVSPEIQKRNSRKGLGPVIMTKDILGEFGSEIRELENKNLSAFFHLQPAPLIEGKAFPETILRKTLMPIGEILFKVYSGEIDGEAALCEIMELYEYMIR